MNENAEIYRRAAEIIFYGRKTKFSCQAIRNIMGDYETDGYSVLFRPDTDSFGVPLGNFWAGKAEKEWGKDGCILALCFAAAMAESGDL